MSDIEIVVTVLASALVMLLMDMMVRNPNRTIEVWGSTLEMSCTDDESHWEPCEAWPVFLDPWEAP